MGVIGGRAHRPQGLLAMHLSELNELKCLGDGSWLARLHALNIRHVEQVGSLLAAPEGRYALERLNVPLAALQAVVEPVLRNEFGLSLAQPLQAGREKEEPLLTRHRYPMGLAYADDRFRETIFDRALPDPPSQRLAGGAPQSGGLPITVAPARRMYYRAYDQGKRGTCAAFTVMAMYQSALGAGGEVPARLSVQYLYYWAKLIDGFGRDEEGTSLAATLRALRRGGCCLDAELGYESRHDFPQRYTVRGHTPERSEGELAELAKAHRIGDFRHVAHSVAAIKQELAAGRVVGVGLAVYELAWYNAMARSRGEIALPLMDTSGPQAMILDKYIGGHAVTLVGYRDNADLGSEDSHRPGGGYFVFRNSWGEDWGEKNQHKEGYGCLPYEYLARFCLEAAVIDPLKRRTTSGGAKPTEVAPAKPAPRRPRKPPTKPRKRK